MPPNFSGQWKSVANEGFDEFLKELHVGSLKIKAIKGATHHIDHNGDEMKEKIVVVNPLISKTHVFKIGGEVDMKGPNDEKMTVTMNWDGDKLVAHMKYTDKNRTQVQTRELEGDEMVLTLELFDGETFVIKCKRRFTRKV